MRFLTLIASSLLFTSSALALDAPKGPVILTVKGTLAHANVGGTAQFDLEMLEKLDGRTGKMKTPWTEGETSFSGPLLRAILKEAGATGSQLQVKALNDYFAEIPIEDAENLNTILATRQNGKVMSIREKGPLFLIYPFDQDPALYNEKYFSRSVWQIKEIEVKP
ncbi:molybdopterin-dependent oxidoreductase [Rhizobium lemnae]|uniref:Molybdopterin-dependent oxidoreductase n=1 Tax=Rhizobium lemnae TaxID=1214924 RepID=A0ABV8E7J9_9HYPH|nr:molybdopterin-dependent oxidoreductase [Rhizobium lemnae]MCJ8508340.1 molybdopterin-dependent oxidoreductase [Rhizobium lemnae]